MSIRNTKIVATLGPASTTQATVTAMIRAGMDVARINFSHGTVSSRKQAVQRVRSAAKALNKPVAILQDLCGPKLRIDTVSPDPLALIRGKRIVITPHPVIGSSEKISMSRFSRIFGIIARHDRILLNDGAVSLRVSGIKKKDVVCIVEKEGMIGSHKGISFPDSDLSFLPTLTTKDLNDLKDGLSWGVDMIALSFVRSSQDIRMLKKLIVRAGKEVPVIAKIEKHEALKNLESIIRESDGIMVARGDLGVETDLETVTLKQKHIIRQCNISGRTVITATQMLESMIERSTPTRAEVADITNAIFDGTDALMLSGETAVGAYPAGAVAQMARIAQKTEDFIDYERFLSAKPLSTGISDCVAHAVCVLAHTIHARAILASTRSGLTPRMISRYRPLPPIITLTPDRAVQHRLNLVWGVYPFLTEYARSTDVLIEKTKRIAMRSGLAKKGDTVIVCSGNPSGISRNTDFIKVLTL